MKKLLSIVLAAIMVMALGVTAFAAVGDTTTLTAKLYKDGEYSATATDDNLSMGDGAVLDATYVENSNGSYTVTIGFAESFKAHYITSYLTSVGIDTNGDGEYTSADGTMIYGTNNASAVVGFQFTVSSIPTNALQYNASFNIKASIMPISAEGDLVIIPASSAE